MVCRGHTFDRRITAALAMLALTSLACAGDRTRLRSVAAAAPMEIPHTVNLALDEQARKHKPVTSVNNEFLALKPGLLPVQWPSHTDVLRTSLVTPQLKGTPVVMLWQYGKRGEKNVSCLVRTGRLRGWQISKA